MLTHLYETKEIQIGARRIEIGVSWRGKPHLSFDPEAGVLLVNVQDMASALERAFTTVHGMLRSNADLRERFLTIASPVRRAIANASCSAAILPLR